MQLFFKWNITQSFCRHIAYLFMQRIRIEDIRNDEWFKKCYDPVKLPEIEDVNLDDVNAVFDDPEVGTLHMFLSSLRKTTCMYRIFFFLLSTIIPCAVAS